MRLLPDLTSSSGFSGIWKLEHGVLSSVNSECPSSVCPAFLYLWLLSGAIEIIGVFHPRSAAGPDTQAQELAPLVIGPRRQKLAPCAQAQGPCWRGCGVCCLCATTL